MHLSTEEKVQIFEKYGKGKTDTGSPEAQIALFSIRIAHLTQHLKSNHKDHTTERALKMLVGKRRRLLDYLMRKDINRYRAIIAQKELGIRKDPCRPLKKQSKAALLRWSAAFSLYKKCRRFIDCFQRSFQRPFSVNN